MRLTIEDNPETVKRYSHLKPASRMGARACGALCPGTTRKCSLEGGHSGPHVAHGRFRKVTAVWDRRAQVPKPVKMKRRRLTTGHAGTSNTALDPGPWRKAVTILRKLMPRPPTVEEIFLLILALSMVGFALDWALRIIGVY